MGMREPPQKVWVNFGTEGVKEAAVWDVEPDGEVIAVMVACETQNGERHLLRHVDPGDVFTDRKHAILACFDSQDRETARAKQDLIVKLHGIESCLGTFRYFLKESNWTEAGGMAKAIELNAKRICEIADLIRRVEVLKGEQEKELKGDQ